MTNAPEFAIVTDPNDGDILWADSCCLDARMLQAVIQENREKPLVTCEKSK